MIGSGVPGAGIQRLRVVIDRDDAPGALDCRGDGQDAGPAAIVDDEFAFEPGSIQPFQAQGGRGMGAGAEGQPGIQADGQRWRRDRPAMPFRLERSKAACRIAWDQTDPARPFPMPDPRRAAS